MMVSHLNHRNIILGGSVVCFLFYLYSLTFALISAAFVAAAVYLYDRYERQEDLKYRERLLGLAKPPNPKRASSLFSDSKNRTTRNSSAKSTGLLHEWSRQRSSVQSPTGNSSRNGVFVPGNKFATARRRLQSVQHQHASPVVQHQSPLYGYPTSPTASFSDSSYYSGHERSLMFRRKSPINFESVEPRKVPLQNSKYSVGEYPTVWLQQSRADVLKPQNTTIKSPVTIKISLETVSRPRVPEERVVQEEPRNEKPDPCSTETVVAALKEKRKRVLKDFDEDDTVNDLKRQKRISVGAGSPFLPAVSSDISSIISNPGRYGLTTAKRKQDLESFSPSNLSGGSSISSPVSSAKKFRNNAILSSYCSSKKLLLNKDLNNSQKRRAESSGHSPVSKVTKHNESIGAVQSPDNAQNETSNKNADAAESLEMKSDSLVNGSTSEKTGNEPDNDITSSIGSRVNFKSPSSVENRKRMNLPVQYSSEEEHKHDTNLEYQHLNELLYGSSKGYEEEEEPLKAKEITPAVSTSASGIPIASVQASSSAVPIATSLFTTTVTTSSTTEGLKGFIPAVTKSVSTPICSSFNPVNFKTDIPQLPIVQGTGKTTDVSSPTITSIQPASPPALSSALTTTSATNTSLFNSTANRTPASSLLSSTFTPISTSVSTPVSSAVGSGFTLASATSTTFASGTVTDGFKFAASKVTSANLPTNTMPSNFALVTSKESSPFTIPTLPSEVKTATTSSTPSFLPVTTSTTQRNMFGIVAPNSSAFTFGAGSTTKSEFNPLKSVSGTGTSDIFKSTTATTTTQSVFGSLPSPGGFSLQTSTFTSNTQSPAVATSASFTPQTGEVKNAFSSVVTSPSQSTGSSVPVFGGATTQGTGVFSGSSGQAEGGFKFSFTAQAQANGKSNVSSNATQNGPSLFPGVFGGFENKTATSSSSSSSRSNSNMLTNSNSNLFGGVQNSSAQNPNPFTISQQAPSPFNSVNAKDTLSSTANHSSSAFGTPSQPASLPFSFSATNNKEPATFGMPTANDNAFGVKTSNPGGVFQFGSGSAAAPQTFNFSTPVSSAVSFPPSKPDFNFAAASSTPNLFSIGTGAKTDRAFARPRRSRPVRK